MSRGSGSVEGMTGEAVLRLPVRSGGAELGRPVDLVVDVETWRAVGVEVICGDRVRRFLPLAAAAIGADEIAVTSSLTLLDEAGAVFYRERTDALSALRGQEVERAGQLLGELVDVLLDEDGAICGLVVDSRAGEVQVPLEGRVRLAGRPASAA